MKTHITLFNHETYISLRYDDDRLLCMHIKDAFNVRGHEDCLRLQVGEELLTNISKTVNFKTLIEELIDFRENEVYDTECREKVIKSLEALITHVKGYNR